MIPSQTMSLKLLAAAGLLLVADPARELRVLRVVPSEYAAPTVAVSITFDRPVAGSLDRTVDPRGLFRIEPAVAGEVDWRDPVTLRFRPAAPLPADRSFTVTVSDRFEAMDGSRLAAPFVHSTVALRAAGGRAGAAVHWMVDDVPQASGRWSLRLGRHRFRAISASGDSAEVTVRVE